MRKDNYHAIEKRRNEQAEREFNGLARATVKAIGNPAIPYTTYTRIYDIPIPQDKSGGALKAHTFVDYESNSSFEHVSFNMIGKYEARLPNPLEIEYIKTLFFEKDDVVVETPLQEERSKNPPPHCVHLWHPIDPKMTYEQALEYLQANLLGQAAAYAFYR